MAQNVNYGTKYETFYGQIILEATAALQANLIVIQNQN
jgi:hypothetical protein